MTGDIARRLRGAWQHHRRCAYVVSGSAQHTLERLASSTRAAFYGGFDLLRLGPLPEAAATELLDRVAGGPVDPAGRKAVLSIAGGNPFYLHALGDALVGGPRDEAAAKDAVQRVLFTSDGRLALHFEAAWSERVGASKGLDAVLAALSGGPSRLTDVARAARADTGAVAASLRRLGEAVVKRDDGRYQIADPVFALWLRWRGPGGTTVPMTVVGSDGERRAAEALAERGFELVYASRASRGAFDLLALRGAEVVAIQVKRRPLPLRFTAGEWERMVAEAARHRWPWVVAQVGDGGVTFLDPAAARRGRGITLDQGAGIDNLPRWVDQATR